MRRTGLIARKLGMSRLFDDQGRHVPVTVLAVDDCQVVGQRTKDSHGYTALQVGAGKARVKRVTKALRGHYAKANVEPKKRLIEFRVSDDALVNVGAELVPSHFAVGQLVDVVGIAIGRGFAGSMKRHNFSGLPASHGVSVSHRSHGSTGNRQDPGRVFKNKKMAGHMGTNRVTVQNLKVVSVDDARGLIVVRGAIPGSANSWVSVSDAVKVPLPKEAPKPAGIKAAAGSAAPAAEETK